MLELTGGEAKLDKLLEVLQPYGVLEMARTGTLAMAREASGPIAKPAPDSARDEAGSDASDVSYSV